MEYALEDSYLSDIIFKHSVEGILVTDQSGKIVHANPSCLNTFGYTLDELVGQAVEVMMPEAFRERHSQHRKGYVQNHQIRQMGIDLELVGLTKAGAAVPLEISLSYAKSKIGLLVICFIVDISRKKQLQDELEDERKMIRQYMDVTTSMFLVINQKGQITLANHAVSALLGMTVQELKGKNWFDEFLPESIRKEVKQIFKDMIEGKTNVTLTYENHVLASNGEKRLIEWHNTLLKDQNGLPIATLSSGTDITEKRAMEKARAEALLLGQENERRRIAEELHDGLAQSISAINLNLNALEPELERFNLKFQQIYTNLKSRLNETLEEVRSISHNLTPRILEDFGLGTALEHLLEIIDQSSGVKLNLSLQGSFSDLDTKLTLNIYRIVQELVNNSLRHANPGNINIYVTHDKTGITVLVEDDGIGFDQKETSFGIGLSNVRSRVEIFNGSLFIDSNPKSGTSISVNIST